MAKELTEGQFTWRLVKRSKINQPSVLQEFTDVRPHRMNVTKAWQHFWKSQGTTRRYSWMGTWCRHNLWSFGWMDAAPLDDWRPHSMFSTWIWLLSKLSCQKELFEACFFCCIRVIYTFLLPTFCLCRCSVRLRRALVSWSAYARLRLPLNFRFCLRGLHLVLLWGLHFVLSFHVLPMQIFYNG